MIILIILGLALLALASVAITAKAGEKDGICKYDYTDKDE